MLLTPYLAVARIDKGARDQAAIILTFLQPQTYTAGDISTWKPSSPAKALRHVLVPHMLERLENWFGEASRLDAVAAPGVPYAEDFQVRYETMLAGFLLSAWEDEVLPPQKIDPTAADEWVRFSTWPSPDPHGRPSPGQLSGALYLALLKQAFEHAGTRARRVVNPPEEPDQRQVLRNYHDRYFKTIRTVSPRRRSARAVREAGPHVDCACQTADTFNALPIPPPPICTMCGSPAASEPGDPPRCDDCALKSFAERLRQLPSWPEAKLRLSRAAVGGRLTLDQLLWLTNEVASGFPDDPTASHPFSD